MAGVTPASLKAGQLGGKSGRNPAWAAELRDLGSAYFFSLNRYVFLARKPD